MNSLSEFNTVLAGVSLLVAFALTNAVGSLVRPVPSQRGANGRIWQLQEAKARLREVIEKAQLVSSQQDLSRGQTLLERTLELSRDKGIKLLGLRAATMRAPLLIARGDSAPAQYLPGRDYEEISEGRDTYPLQQAVAAVNLLGDSG